MNRTVIKKKTTQLLSAMVTGYKVNLKWISARSTHSITHLAKLVFTINRDKDVSELMTVDSQDWKGFVISWVKMIKWDAVNANVALTSKRHTFAQY